MKIEWFAGFIIGNLIGISLAGTVFFLRRRKGIVDQDERTALIKAQAGAAAFYVSGGAAYLGWIACTRRAAADGRGACGRSAYAHTR